MNEINTDYVLGQIRALSAELQPPGVAPGSSSTPTDGPQFGSLLKQTLDSVNEAQQASSEAKLGFINGTSDRTLAEVMVAAQKADLSFRAMSEVRNKLVNAYQEIMNMPV